MATYKVGSDGRAQSGLSVGDEVVTAGGTYKITGVNADGSYKSTLSDANQTTGNYAGSYSTGRSSAASTVPDTTDGTVKVANKNVYADMARNQDLAGQTVWKNGYAITYDANGYATKAVRSESPNYSGHTDFNVTGSGSVGVGENMWTDEQILTAEDLARIAAIRAQGAAGTISWAEANAQANAIRSGYGYTIDQSGTVVDQMALDRATAAQQATGATAYYDKTAGTYQPIVSPPKTNVGTVTQTPAIPTTSATGTATPQVSLPDLPGLSLGGVEAPEFETGEVAVGSVPPYEVGDYSQYIKDLYAANAEAELAALEDAYKTNVGTLQSAAERIGETYHTAQNAAAAQNALGRQAMNEYMAAWGLNSGTAGQAALAQSAALQSQLGSLSAQEAQAITDNQREQNELERQYQSAIVQAKANGNSALAAALYEEMIRQDSARQSAAQAAQEQANWEAQFALSQQQNRNELLQQQYENAFAQQQYRDQQTQQSFENDLLLRQYEDALAQQAYENALAGAKSASSGSSGGSGGSGSSMTLTTAKAMMKAGQFTDEAVQTMLDAGFNEEYLRNEYGYGEVSGEVSGYDEVLADIQTLRQEGTNSATINNVIVQAQAAGLITSQQALELRGAYVGNR